MNTRTALPGKYVDLARDGIPVAQWRRGGDKAIYLALRSIATSAIQRGWTEAEWIDLIDHRDSELGRQNRMAGRPRRRMEDAWNSATKFLADPANAPRTAERAREDARVMARALLDIAADSDSDLSVRERRVLAYFAERGLELGSDQITLSRDAIKKAISMGSTTFADAVGDLDARGLVSIVQRGHKWGDGPKRVATVYKVHLPKPEKSLSSPAALAATVSSPPPSSPTAVSSPPASEEGAEIVPMAAIHLTDEELDLIIRRRAAADAATTASGERAPAAVIPIRREAQ